MKVVSLGEGARPAVRGNLRLGLLFVLVSLELLSSSPAPYRRRSTQHAFFVAPALGRSRPLHAAPHTAILSALIPGVALLPLTASADVMLPPAVSQPTGLPTAPEPSTAGLSSFLPSPLDLSSVVLAESTSSVGEGYREGIKNVAAVQGYSQLEELSFADFMEQIRSNAGSNPITRVTFIGSRAERCVVLYADGTRKRLGEGYPRESPTSQETPQWVVARVRELRIPYDFTINLGRYRDRGVDENYMTPGARKQEMLEQQFGRQQTR